MYDNSKDKAYTSSKPVLTFRRRFTCKSFWVCRLYSKKHMRIIAGRGAKPESAYKAYKRNLKWYDQGCPGKTRRTVNG